MKKENILKVFKKDIKNIVRNPIAIIIIAALCIIPSLYAWINIAACWDVYENTGSIPVAVVNRDNMVILNGKLINIGADVVEELKENDKIKWTFVSREEADQGLLEGRYYASIEIPATFTDNFLSILTENPINPKIIYKVDTKSNPVAVKIADSAKNTLVEQIKSNFVATVNETVFSSLNTLGDDADDKKEDLIKYKDAIVNINRNLELFENTLDNVYTGSTEFGTFMNSMYALMPSVDQSIDVLEANNNSKETILRDVQLTVNQALDDVDTNLSMAIASNNRIHDLVATLNDTNEKLGNEKIDKTVYDILVQFTALDNSISATVDYLQAIQSVDINKDIQDAIDQLTDLQTKLENFKAQLQKLQTALGSTSDSLESLSKNLEDQINSTEQNAEAINAALDSSITQLEKLNETLNNPALSQIIDQLKSVQAQSVLDQLVVGLKAIQISSSNLKTQIDGLNASIDDMIDTIDQVDKEISNGIRFLNDSKASNVSRNSRINEINNNLRIIQGYNYDAQSQIGDIQKNLNASNILSKAILDQINDNVSSTSNKLLEVQKSFQQEGKKAINDIIGYSIVSNLDTASLIKSIRDLQNHLSDTINSAAQGGQLTADLASEANETLEDVKDLVEMLGDRFEMINNKDISLMIDLLRSNPEFMGDFMSNPFDLKTETINAVPNYGSSMAPVYTTLALWVGCLLLNAVLNTFPGQSADVEVMSIKEKHFGKMLLFCSLATIQGLIAAVGDIWLLKIHVTSPVLFIVFALLASLIFSSITYTLKATLSNLGKALGVIYMILQLAGSGGTYPIQVDPLIFRILQPLFPFTYAVNGFREAVAGAVAINVAQNIFALLLFGIVFTLFGYLTIDRLYPKVRKFELKLKKSGLGE